MRTIIGGVLLLALATPAWTEQPATATTAPTAVQDNDAAERSLIDQATVAIEAGKPGAALPFLEQVIANEEKAHAGETRQVFCARSPAEVILYAAMGVKQKTGAIVLGPAWATAIFLKGFAYIDLGRAEEARALFDRAIAMSPMNAHFVAELGEWYRTHNDWKTAYGKFEQAAAYAEFSPDKAKSFDKRRALRGMAFILSDEGKYDEAEALYHQCLTLDPNDAKAKHELEYIREQRAKASSTS